MDSINLWAQRFDSTLGDLFGIQDEVCTAVAEALHVRLGAPIGEHRPSNVDAYVQYLKGAYLLKKRRPSDVRRAFEYFREAIRLEPHYAEPYYGAAMYYNVSAAYGALSPRSALPEAEDLLSKGLALDKSSVRLHSTLGMLRVFQWRWTEAEQSCQRAISLESTNPFAHITYPILCSFLGRHEEALLHARKAVELDPLDLMTNFRLLQANYYARRYEDAVRCGRLAIELTPDSPYNLAFSLAALGLQDEAWAVASTGRKLNDGLPLGEGYFGFVAGILGHAIEARGVIGELRARRERGYSAALPIAFDLSWSRRKRPRFPMARDSPVRGRPIPGIANGIPRLRRRSRSTPIQAAGRAAQTPKLVEAPIRAHQQKRPRGSISASGANSCKFVVSGAGEAYDLRP